MIDSSSNLNNNFKLPNSFTSQKRPVGSCTSLDLAYKELDSEITNVLESLHLNPDEEERHGKYN